MKDGRSGWSEMAATYDRTRSFPGDGDRIVPAAVARRLRELCASRVLDLGCGTGRFLLPLAHDGIRVVGADRSPEMLAMLASKPGAESAHFVRCDAERLPFAPEIDDGVLSTARSAGVAPLRRPCRAAFDAVLFSHFLHLLPSLETFARELRRVLVPGAHVVVVDTTSGPRPATLRVLAIAMPILEQEWKPWPDGDESKDRSVFRELIGHLGARELEPQPVATFPATGTLRDVLHHVRERTWWTFRVHAAEAGAAAAAAAERQLVAEGADLDAPIDEPVVVRLLAARA